MHHRRDISLWSASTLYINYVWLRAFPDVWRLVAPYLTKTFNDQWKPLLARTVQGTFPDIDGLLEYISKETYGKYLSRTMVSDVLWFLRQYREGAFVVLSLIDVARWGNWLYFERHKNGWRLEPFPYSCMLDFPGFANTDPIELLRFIRTLNELMRTKVANTEAFYDTLVQYYMINPFYHSEYFPWMEDTSSVSLRERVSHFFTGKPSMYFDKAKFITDLTENGRFLLGAEKFVFDIDTHREDVRVLQNALNDHWEEFAHRFPAAASRWAWRDNLARTYLLARASDLVMFDKPIADLTFPKPLFPGADELVSALVTFLQEAQQRLDEENIRKEVAKYRPGYEREAAEKAAVLTVDLPAHLPAKVLSDTERDRLTAVCLEELLQSEQGGWKPQGTLKVIEEFARVCQLLSMPENWIKDRCGQFTTRLVPSRSVDDMAHEMRQELINLPRHTAYAKVIDRQDEKQIVLKQKIRTFPPLPPGEGDRVHLERAAIERTHSKHSRRRDLIEQELWHRHTQWREAQARKAAARQKQRDRSPPPKQPEGEDPPPGNT